MSKYKSIHILFHEFHVKMIFHKTDLVNQRDILFNSIHRYYACIGNSNQKPDITLEVVDDAQFGLYTKKADNRTTYYEEIALYKKSHMLVSYNTSASQIIHLIYHHLQKISITKKLIPIHASAVIIHGKLVLFIGNSGAGKSTISKMFGPNNHFADEQVYLKIHNKKIWGLPNFFLEKNIIIQDKKNPIGYEIGSILQLTKSTSNLFKPLPTLEFIHQFITPRLLVNKYEKKTVQLYKKICELMISNTITYGVLYFTKSKKTVVPFVRALFDIHG